MVSGASSTAFTAAESLSTISFGVPAGASTKMRGATSKPGTASANGATFSTPSSFAVFINASARCLPALACAMPAVALTTPMGNCPPITSGTICAAPRYGTCTAKLPEACLSSSNPQCCTVPTPEVPNE